MFDLERVKNAIQSVTPAPLYVKIKRAIHTQIVDGTLQAGEKLPSERRLQKEMGLSRGPIRQAVNALVQEGLLKRLPGVGTFVLEMKQAHVQSALVGLITFSHNFHFFYPQLTAKFGARLQRAGYGLSVAVHNDRADELSHIAENFLMQGVVALAIAPPRYGDITPLITLLSQNGIPLVFVGRRSSTMVIDCVAPNNEQVGYEATRYLLNLGHKHIVHIGFSDYSTGQERATGYRHAMGERNLTPTVVELPLDHSASSIDEDVLDDHLVEPAYQVAQQLWGKDKFTAPTAAFCFNDITAIGVYKALRDLSLRVPEDVSIVAVDNLLSTRHFEVPLTTFALPGSEIGTKAADLLVAHLNGEQLAPQHYLLPSRFIERLSATAAV